MPILKTISCWLFSFYRSTRKIRNLFFLHRNTPKSHQHHLVSISSCGLEGRNEYSLFFNYQSFFFRANSLFPFFMVVAFEGGSAFRAFLLILGFPLVFLLGFNTELSLRVMVFVTFCGLKCSDMDVVVRSVLPKVFLEEIDSRSFEKVLAARNRVVVCNLPKLMVEKFLNDCFGESVVLGPELGMVRGKYFSGMLSSGTMAKMVKAFKDRFGEVNADSRLQDHCETNTHQLFSSKGAYIKTDATEIARISKTIPDAAVPTATIPTGNDLKRKYAKPLIFHDGRLAFLPTPSATISLFLYLPFAFLLSILRLVTGILLPYSVSPLIAAALGIHFRVVRPRHECITSSGVLYVCTHRTLLDPVFLSHAISRPIPVVTYSLSRFSESISPIPTVRLTRDRIHDSYTIRRLLAIGDLVICPEGTTCREPYLLRFSPLFAELADDIEPVAIDAESSMFYGTTATGMKSLDPIFFFMNPRPGYRVTFLGKLQKEMTVSGGCSAATVANQIQHQLAQALGFQCTTLTRKDKYLLLAGNNGAVPSSSM